MNEHEQKLFDRALQLIMNEWGQTREEAIEWLSDDNSPTWETWDEPLDE